MAESTDTTILSPGSMLVSDSEQMTAQILLAWLAIPNDREERRFMEMHPELLGLESESILNELIVESPQDKVPSLRDHLKLLLDGRARGGTAAAIREAYVNMHGGFNLDLPPWLEEVKEQFDERIASGRPDQTTAERVALLQNALALAREDDTIAPEMIASLYCKLAMAWWEDEHGDRIRAVEAMIDAEKAALQIYQLSRYPYMYASRQNNLGMAYRNRVEGDQRANVEQAIAYYMAALEIFTPDSCPGDYAMVQLNLGIAYQNRIVGERGTNLEQAITCHQLALPFYGYDSFPLKWAWLQYYLGNAYYYRIEGTRQANLEQTITHFEAALRVINHEAFPQEWAEMQYYLGLIYSERSAGDPSANQEQAVACYKASLQFYTRETFPGIWAYVQHRLGDIYDERLAGMQAENQERKIACYEEALRFFTRRVDPARFAALQRNLGIAYRGRLEGGKRANLERAISCYEKALLVYTRAAFPEKWASMQEFLAYIYEERLEGDQSANQEKVIACYHMALQVYTFEAFPEDYARIQRFLGGFYRNRVKGEQRTNLERAITSYEAALRVYTQAVYPEKWANTQCYLGAAYEKRIAGKRRANLERALACYEAALQVNTREAAPREYSEAEFDLGNVYSERVEGERRENLERAIACYEAALQVYTPEIFPKEWAETLNRLGYVYIKRIDGEQNANVEKAIECYEAASQVYTQEAFPQDYARIQNNLGIAYGSYFQGDRGANVERQIQCFQAALRIFSFDSFPDDWVSTHNNLGGAYAERIAGERRENLEQAISHYTEALRLRTREASPETYAKTLHNLGNVYKDRIEGEQRANLEQAAAYYREALQILTLEAFPADHRTVQLNLAETEIVRENWIDAHEACSGARAAEDLLVALGKGVAGRDAILMMGRGFAALDAFALTRLGRVADAAVAIERGRTRGMAEALALDAADPKRISDGARRARYEKARKAFIVAQSLVNASLPGNLAESERRLIALERFRVYGEAQSAFNDAAVEIRAARDPADFLLDTIDAATILQASSCGGHGHALVYLLYTPYAPHGGMALAALAGRPAMNSEAHFATLDLPALTYRFVGDLVEDNLGDESNPVIGGFVYAQEGNGYRLIRQGWSGETFRARAEGLHAFCAAHGRRSKLDEATQYLLGLPALSRIVDQPLHKLTASDVASLEAAIAFHHLQRELPYCLEVLAKTLMRPVVSWLLEQGVTSLTLIPCGWLAAFPLAAVPLDDGRAVSDVLPTSVAPGARSLLHYNHTQTGRAGVYALGNPHPTQTELAWAEAEALALSSLARRLHLHSEVRVQYQATRSWLIQALSRGYIVDASCHGSFNIRVPLDSALQLAKGQRLLLVDLLSHKVNLQGLRLLILSACQTAILDTRGAMDEAHSLAVGMVQAGAEAVLAALWRVDDKATYLLIARFAQEWLPRIEQEPPAAALARAQHWLRTVTNRELRDWQANALEAITEKEQRRLRSRVQKRGSRLEASGMGQVVATYTSRFDASEAEKIIGTVAKQQHDPDACPYADLVYWAGFQVVGW